MVNVGDVVIWIDAEMVKHDARVTKIKRDNQLDLEWGIKGEMGHTTVTDAAHKSVQHPDYGCYWEEKV